MKNQSARLARRMTLGVSVLVLAASLSGCGITSHVNVIKPILKVCAEEVGIAAAIRLASCAQREFKNKNTPTEEPKP